MGACQKQTSPEWTFNSGQIKKTHFVPITSDKSVTFHIHKKIFESSNWGLYCNGVESNIKNEELHFLWCFSLSLFFFFRTGNNVHPNNIDTVQEPTSDRGLMNLCFEVNGMEGKTKNKYQIHSEMFDIQECEWTLRHDLKTKWKSQVNEPSPTRRWKVSTFIAHELQHRCRFIGTALQETKETSKTHQ